MTDRNGWFQFSWVKGELVDIHLMGAAYYPSGMVELPEYKKENEPAAKGILPGTRNLVIEIPAKKD